MEEEEEVDFSVSRSDADQKEYRLITLECGLECLLVSTLAKDLQSPAASGYNKAAAAMAVQVGSFGDPVQTGADDCRITSYRCFSMHYILLSHRRRCLTSSCRSHFIVVLCYVLGGCAHLLEHMLFMGSEKYPDENHYDSFISTHGGFCNAFTEGEHTVYQFDVDNEAFAEALDIFAHCFISPLLSSSAVQREVLAVESEFVGARMSDSARLQQLLCHLSSGNDLMGKFSWGNARSLSAGGEVDVHCLLSRLHSLNYAPPNMKLAVIASKSLSDMEAVVRGCFSSWTDDDDDASGSIQRPPLAKRQRMQQSLDGGWISDGYEDDLLPPMLDSIARLRGVDIMPPLELRTVTRVAPIKSGHKLVMVWQLPSCHTVAGYRCKPHDFIGHLLGHEGAGSILSCLKRSNLATSVVAGVSDSNIGSNSMFSLFELAVELTQGGLCNWLLVVGVVHQYLHMLRDTSTVSSTADEECECRRVFQELQHMSELSYRKCRIVCLVSSSELR